MPRAPPVTNATRPPKPRSTRSTPLDRREFKDLYFEAWKAGLKGTATYRPNALLGAVLEAAPAAAPVAEPQDFDTADPDRRIQLDRAHQPPLSSLRWPGRPELSNGNPCCFAASVVPVIATPSGGPAIIRPT